MVLRTFAGDSLFGQRTGAGAARVLALHGWGRTHRDFDAVLGADAPSGEPALDAIAIDLPGFGASPPPPEPWGSERYAHALVEVLEEMAPQVVVLGHSFGGRVALSVALARPEQVCALVLTGTPLVPIGARRRAPLAFRATRLLHRAGVVSDATMEAARDRHGSSDYRAAHGVVRQVLVRVLSERYEAALDQLRCPVTLVWGTEDTTVPLAVAERALERLQERPGGIESDLVICPGVGHLLPLEAPQALRSSIEAHLE